MFNMERYIEEYHETCGLMGYSQWDKIKFHVGSWLTFQLRRVIK